MGKRIFDYVIALCGIFFAFPLWCVICWAIWLQDGSPVLYCQQRSGWRGVIFNSFKFRSMIKGAEEKTGPVQATENDPRVTTIGVFLRRSALDELPQLFNILKGQMSFVGPRPLRPQEIEVSGMLNEQSPQDSLFTLRLQVRPGLTGVAQLYAPRALTRKKKARYDIWYIRNRSLCLDVVLMLRSVWISIRRRWDTVRRPGRAF